MTTWTGILKPPHKYTPDCRGVITPTYRSTPSPSHLSRTRDQHDLPHDQGLFAFGPRDGAGLPIRPWHPVTGP